MPMSVQCPNPNCGRTFEIPDDAAGREMKCPYCGLSASAPQAGPGAPGEGQGPPPPPPGYQPPPNYGPQQPPPPPGYGPQQPQQPPGYGPQQPPGYGPPPPPGYGPPMGMKPPNCLVWAILATLFCCLPFGIVAIVYAAQVDSKFNTGDYYGALKSSDNAKKWCWASFITGLVVTVLMVVVQIATVSRY